VIGSVRQVSCGLNHLPGARAHRLLTCAAYGDRLMVERRSAASRLLGTKSVILVVDHDRCKLPPGVCFLQQVNDARPLQFLSVGLAAYGDAPGDHGGCAQPFEVEVDQLALGEASRPQCFDERVETAATAARVGAGTTLAGLTNCEGSWK
jgi:hypothetical protein